MAEQPRGEDAAEAASVLRKLVAAVERGDMDAPRRTSHALTGAALALEAYANGSSEGSSASRQG